MKTLSFLLLAVPLLAQSTPPVGQTITLTTNGTSGSSTLQGNVLNVPQYSGGTNATTINGAAVPSSASCLGSNGSSQLTSGCTLSTAVQGTTTSNVLADFHDAVIDCGMSTSNTAAANTTAINACVSAHPNWKIFFADGTYNLHNASVPGMYLNGFNGTLEFGQSAGLQCDTDTGSSLDCVKVLNGTGTTINNLHILSQGMISRSSVNTAAAIFHIATSTNAHITHVRVDGGPNVCLLDDANTNANYYDITLNNCSSNAFFSPNSYNTQLDGLRTNVSLDSGLEVTSYTPASTWFQATNVNVLNSAGHGISVVGQNHVQISNFFVDGTCNSGVAVFRDTTISSAIPDDVKVSHGSVRNLGTYSNSLNPGCSATNPNGIYFEGVGVVDFNDISIYNAGFEAVLGGASGTGSATNTYVSLRGVRAYSGNGGFVIYNTTKLDLSEDTIDTGTMGFLLYGSSILTMNNLTANNVNPSNGLNRAFDVENMTTCSAGILTVNDTQATPTGYKVLTTGTSGKCTINAINSYIPSGSLSTTLDSNTTLGGPIPTLSQIGQATASKSFTGQNLTFNTLTIPNSGTATLSTSLQLTSNSTYITGTGGAAGVGLNSGLFQGYGGTIQLIANNGAITTTGGHTFINNATTVGGFAASGATIPYQFTANYGVTSPLSIYSGSGSAAGCLGLYDSAGVKWYYVPATSTGVITPTSTKPANCQ